jgi:xylan 1,4-beta-xylosidase
MPVINLLKQEGIYNALPFYEVADDDSKRYDIENIDPNPDKPKIIQPYEKDQIQRDFRVIFIPLSSRRYQ